MRSKFMACCSTAAITLGIFVLVASCRKNRDTASEDTGYATDHANTEKSFNDVQSISDQASTTATGTTMAYKTSGITGLSHCATVTRTPGAITIDFGTTDCLCNDGSVRRGKILVTYTGNYADAGSVHSITFDNFYQNDNQVMGTKTVTNMGNNAAGQPYFTISINGSVALQSGGTVSAVWNRVRTWTKGYDTPADMTDDQYEITGNGVLTRANGTTVDININTATPLVAAWGCRWIEAGTVTYNLSTGGSRSVNFGSNAAPACDDQATVTLASGRTINVTMK